MAETPAPERVSTRITVPDDRSMVALLGSRDELLTVIERVLDSDVHVRGNEITLTGQPADNAVATRLFVGGNTTCAQLATGIVQCWGAGARGQLGNGTETDAASPVTIPALASATQIASGNFRGCARLGSGLACWGETVLFGDGDVSRATPSAPVVPCP